MYCVYLTTYNGSKLPMFYIGSSSIKKVNSGYHGSVGSKLYKEIYNQELIDNPQLFNTKIIFTSNDRLLCRNKENYLQIKLNVISNPMYINRSYANGCFGDNYPKRTGINHPLYGIGPMKGRLHSKESKEKMSHTHTGENHWNFNNEVPNETKSKISASLVEYYKHNVSSRKGKKCTPEHCKKNGDAHRGISHSIETKDKIKSSLKNTLSKFTKDELKSKFGKPKELNGMFGKIRIYNPTTKERKILDKFEQIPENWIRGTGPKYQTSMT